MLSHYFAAPTLVSIGGVPCFADRMRLVDLALLLQAAADFLGIGDDAEEPLKFSDPAMSAWLEGDGFPILLWCSLRRSRPGWQLAEAFAEAAGVAEAEKVVIIWAALRHGRKKDDRPRGDAVDIALGKWGSVLRWFAAEGKGLPTEVGEYTVEQADILLAEHDPEAKQELDRRASIFAEWEAEHRRIHGEPKAEEAAPKEVTLADLGYAVVPGQGQEQETPGEAKGDEHGDDGQRWADDGGAAPDV